MSEMDASLFQSFSDAMPFGVCLVDTHSKIVYWNAAAEAIAGYLGQEVVGRTYRTDLLLHCEDNARAEVQCPVTEALRDGRAVESDLFLRHKRGHRLQVHVSAFPLRDEMGGVRGVAEVFYPAQGRREAAGWSGFSREAEPVAGLPAVEESREQLQTLLRSRFASTSALILIEMIEQQAIQKHGGTPMLHQALRVLARTVAGLLPPRNYVGSWCNWRLLAIVPECSPEALERIHATLDAVGSSCAVKWWGDRIVIGMRAAACYADSAHGVNELTAQLEQALHKSAGERKE